MNTTLTQRISMAILMQVAAGSTVQEAIDAVLGAGTHAALAGELYEALRAKREG